MTPEKTRMSKDKAVPTPIAVVEIFKRAVDPLTACMGVIRSVEHNEQNHR
ncbi:hypothetical protein TMU3MR103_2006 [Tetragenococcus muriaticus 3MR10-3]|uniref:Uncharacterized protein n=1 Tax=Tetragenococcus muriaticus 3MR10-3 TaxID=1302648 RepID=A0A091BXM1_9ENTE|nr:hypothetical protein TMU3MR103_2006 [Tetragenococcus muriaticus 3MR10-3]